MKTFSFIDPHRFALARLLTYSVVVLLTGFVGRVHAETLTEYVNSCKSQLNFQDKDVPTLSCYDGEFFAPRRDGEIVNDSFGYRKVTDDVDLTFACRWVNGNKTSPHKGASAEMMLHNHTSGKTCYFSTLEQGGDGGPGEKVSPLMLSVTGSDLSNLGFTKEQLIAYGFPNTIDPNNLKPTDAWRPPSEISTSGFQCVTCHIKGPYISSRRIVPYLSKFGIMNNGHDNYRKGVFNNSNGLVSGNGYQAAVTSSNPAFAHFNSVIYGTIDGKDALGAILDDKKINVDKATASCSSGCHDIVNWEFPRLDFTNLAIILPSIHTVVSETAGIYGEMEPWYKDSEYRWFNLHSVAGGGDSEKFSDVKNDSRYSYIQNYCDAPKLLEARAVGSDLIFTSKDKFPDKLDFFNVREGLKCTDNQQPSQKCNDYEVRYFCPTGLGSGGIWTQTYDEAWYDVDDPGPTADDESRSALVAKGITLCGGKEPIGIQARTKVNGSVYSYLGPKDRLSQLDSQNLVCRNSDQPNGASCSNYAVRYKQCSQDTYIPTSNYYEIQVTVVPTSFQDISSGDFNVYVGDVPLTQYGNPIYTGAGNITDTERDYYTYVFRTNATGELTIVTHGTVDVVKVTVNDVRKPQLDKRRDIVVRARGTSGSEVIRVTAAGQEIARFTLSTAWKEYRVTPQIFGGVNVEFVNDANGRDAQVDWVKINDSIRQAEDQTYNTATYANGRCGGAKGEMMHCGSNTNSSYGIIGFGDVVDSKTMETEISYGHIASVAMPSVVTVVGNGYDTADGTCYDLSAYNTTSSTQNIKFNFEILDGKTLSKANNFKVTSNNGRVIAGSPESWMTQTLAPFGNSNLYHFWYCAK